jgi:peroxiredoxin
MNNSMSEALNDPSQPKGSLTEAFEFCLGRHAHDALLATGVLERYKRAGDAAPEVTLVNTSRKLVRLEPLWRRSRSLVVVFYRGGWCSYCCQQLRAWQEQEATMNRLGVGLIAICPQTPDHLLQTQLTNGLSFTNLSDSALDAANGFNIGCILPPELVDVYTYIGTDVPVLNDNGQWVLPIPATFLVGQDGIIQFARIEVDLRKRTQPAEVLRATEARNHAAGVNPPAGEAGSGAV